MATEIIYRSCPTCEASCGLKCEIDRAAKQVIRIEGDPDDPRSRGYLCGSPTKSQILRKIDAG